MRGGSVFVDLYVGLSALGFLWRFAFGASYSWLGRVRERMMGWIPERVEGWLPGSQGRVPDLPLVYPVERAAVVAA